jgi:hypothetical protein
MPWQQQHFISLLNQIQGRDASFEGLPDENALIWRMSDPEERVMKFHRWILVIVGMLMAGCASAETETATPVGTPLIAATSGPTIVSPAASPIPGTQAATIPSIAPTRDPEPIPEGPLSAEGPWRIFIARMKCKLEACPQQLWIMNEDGSGLELLMEGPVVSLAIRPGASTAHAEIAVVTGVHHEEGPPKELYMLTLPERTLTRIVQLSPSGDPLLDDFQWAEFNAGRLAWSPGGSVLAFTGATWGPTSDVYTYYPASGEVKQISDGPLHADWPRWSPDGRWLIHEAVDTRPEPGPIASNGIWAASADGEIVRSLFDPMLYEQDCCDYGVFGWPADTTVFAGSFNKYVGGGEVRAIDMVSGEFAVVRAAADLADAAYNSAGNEWLFLYHDNDDTTPDRLVYKNAAGEREIALEGEVLYDVWWSSTLEMFIVPVSYQFAMGWTASDGWLDLHAPEVVATTPDVSPEGAWWAWYYGYFQSSDPGLWISAPFEAPRQIEDSLVLYAFWSPDGNYLLYQVAAGGFWMASAPDFTPRQLSEADIDSVAWSADGNHAFLSAGWGKVGLWIADAPDFVPRLISDSLYHFGSLYRIPAE